MKLFVLIVVVTLSSTSCLRANLGDDETQLMAHYGKPLGAKTTDKAGDGAVVVDRLSFNKGGLQIDVIIYEGISAEESVYHRPYQGLTDVDVRGLLDSNQGGQTWTVIAPRQETLKWLKSVETWQRTDGAIASLEEPKDKPRLLFHVKSVKLSDAQDQAGK